MKKRGLTKKLVLRKEIIATLNSDEMNLVFAGAKTEIGTTCITDAVCCPLPNPTATQLC